MIEFFTSALGIAVIIAAATVVFLLLSVVFYRVFFKRFYDVFLSLIAIIILFPILLILIILGAIMMKGNPFFTQERPGKKEKIFKLIKFRTMSNKKDAEGNLLPDDKRLSGYGKFLRATSLDELPEIFNIFIGQMSIIGPRPLLVQYLPFYNDEQKKRHLIRPGLTGFAQVSGRNALTWEQKFEKDIYYFENLSFFLDAKIFLLTIVKVFKREGIDQAVPNAFTGSALTDTKEDMTAKETATSMFKYYPQMFLDERGGELSGSKMEEIERKIASAVPFRSLVFCMCTNSIDCAAGYIAFLNLKIVPLMLDQGLAKELLTSLLDTYKPDYLYAPMSLAERESWGDGVISIGEYVLVKNESSGKTKLHPDLALLLTTSGSTGSAKLVRQTYKNIESNARAIIEYLDITESDRPITTLPMNYTYGLSIINSHLLAKATILCTGYNFFQREFWQFFKEYEATTFGGVPYNFEMLKKLRFFNMDLPSLKYLTQAGGKLTKELTQEYVEHCADKKIDFIVMYGQTEATARMSYLPKDKAISKCGSIGIEIPGGRFELIDDAGNLITSSDVDGELVYYGDNVTMGYAECAEDLSKGDEWEGKLITGDMARRDGDGYYYITGRKKRFVKIFGNRVNLDECERLLKGNEIVGDCACGGTDDNLIVYITDAEKTEAVKSFLTEKTSISAFAVKVKVIDEIPKNEAGKTVYAKLPS